MRSPSKTCRCGHINHARKLRCESCDCKFIIGEKHEVITKTKEQMELYGFLAKIGYAKHEKFLYTPKNIPSLKDVDNGTGLIEDLIFNTFEYYRVDNIILLKEGMFYVVARLLGVTSQEYKNSKKLIEEFYSPKVENEETLSS
jgi:hypothetical protein